MWKLFQTTPTEMMHCSFLKPFTPMSVKYWKPSMVSAESLSMNYCQWFLWCSGLLVVVLDSGFSGPDSIPSLSPPRCINLSQ